MAPEKHMDKKSIMEKAINIKLAVFDVDGVLTDGKLILGESGNEYKSFHVRDGHGLVMLLETGCKIAVITARSSNIVAERMASLGIKYVYQGEKDKGARLLKLIDELGLERNQVAYVGDDVIDLPAMIKVGLPIAVADAHPEVKNNADWTTENRGGQGAVREVCELIMRAQGKFDDLIKAYLST
jgi:3-deoxy-D-manno-octulosonate 8-phosphate phosphatase (KDO 8-P phosphatase)